LGDLFLFLFLFLFLDLFLFLFLDLFLDHENYDRRRRHHPTTGQTPGRVPVRPVFVRSGWRSGLWSCAGLCGPQIWSYH
jgi:hypothetical protein